jgi:hypothetical protein
MSSPATYAACFDGGRGNLLYHGLELTRVLHTSDKLMYMHTSVMDLCELKLLGWSSPTHTKSSSNGVNSMFSQSLPSPPHIKLSSKDVNFMFGESLPSLFLCYLHPVSTYVQILQVGTFVDRLILSAGSNSCISPGAIFHCCVVNLSLFCP